MHGGLRRGIGEQDIWSELINVNCVKCIQKFPDPINKTNIETRLFDKTFKDSANPH